MRKWKYSTGYFYIVWGTRMRMIDGELVPLTAEQETNLNNWWAMKAQHPEYEDACIFDWCNAPIWNIEIAKKIHSDLIDKARSKALDNVKENIENALDNGDDTTAWYALRKLIKNTSVDLVDANNIDEIKSNVPAALVDYIK